MKIFSEGISYRNIYLFFCLIVFVLMIFGCSKNESVKKPGKYIVLKEGLIYKAGQDVPFTGRVLDTLNSNIIQYDVIDGIKNGEFYLTSLSGNPLMKGTVKNNKNVGKWLYLYENGGIESEGSFKNDKPHGKWIWYRKDGSKKSEGYYINGKQVGAWQNYDSNGRLIKIIHYDAGKKIGEIAFTKPGSV